MGCGSLFPTHHCFFPFLYLSFYFLYLSGLKLMPYTGPLCPWRILDSLAVFSSMILSSTSSDSLSIIFKSWVKEKGKDGKGLHYFLIVIEVDTFIVMAHCRIRKSWRSQSFIVSHCYTLYLLQTWLYGAFWVWRSTPALWSQRSLLRSDWSRLWSRLQSDPAGQKMGIIRHDFHCSLQWTVQSTSCLNVNAC